MEQQQQQQASLEKDPTLKGVVGIQNMGNTCYSNSVLQLLRSCPEWNMFCLTETFTNDNPDDMNKKRMIIAYQDMLKSLWSAYKPAYVRPLGFLTEIRKAVKDSPYEMFGIPVPNDSHEFLVYLLDQFHEAIKTETPYVEQKVDFAMSSVEKMRILAENGWNKFVSKNTSELVRLFFGMMRKTVNCTNCNNNTYQWEMFNSLKIPCDGTTFHEWIQKEVNESSDIEGYRCDSCNGRHLAKKSSHLWRLPQCLFITLHRFHYDGRKNMTPCPYDGQPVSFQAFFAPEVIAEQDMYELRGISDHHGTHMGGHYTAQFKHPISNQWWWFDDDRAEKIENPKFSASNYILHFALFKKKCAKNME